MRRAGCLLALWLLTACGRQEPPPTPAPASAEAAQAADEAARLQAVGTTRYISSAPLEKPVAQPVAAAAQAPPWTAEPTAAAVPEQPVSGRLRGRDFICRRATVSSVVEAGLPVYRLRLSNRAAGSPSAFELDDDAVTIEWHQPSAAGELVRALTAPRPAGNDAWFVIEQADGAPLTCSAEFALYLRIDAQRGSTQTAGAPGLRGRLLLCFDDAEKSCLAGTFTADGCR
ncbi:MAG: hypothetical protein IT204_23100 [Fimbriimonadaceae bacterium]|nr:hypothetical protein [Fimbriimonadaceae bacterium]